MHNFGRITPTKQIFQGATNLPIWRSPTASLDILENRFSPRRGCCHGKEDDNVNCSLRPWEVCEFEKEKAEVEAMFWSVERWWFGHHGLGHKFKNQSCEVHPLPRRPFPLGGILWESSWCYFIPVWKVPYSQSWRKDSERGKLPRRILMGQWSLVIPFSFPVGSGAGRINDVSKEFVVYHVTLFFTLFEEGSKHKLNYLDQDWSWNQKASVSSVWQWDGLASEWHAVRRRYDEVPGRSALIFQHPLGAIENDIVPKDIILGVIWFKRGFHTQICQRFVVRWVFSGPLSPLFPAFSRCWRAGTASGCKGGSSGIALREGGRSCAAVGVGSHGFSHDKCVKDDWTTFISSHFKNMKQLDQWLYVLFSWVKAVKIGSWFGMKGTTQREAGQNALYKPGKPRETVQKREGNDNSSHKKWNESGEYPQTPALQFGGAGDQPRPPELQNVKLHIGQEKSKASSSMTFNIWHKSPSRTHFMYAITWKRGNSASWPVDFWARKHGLLSQ